MALKAYFWLKVSSVWGPLALVLVNEALGFNPNRSAHDNQHFPKQQCSWHWRSATGSLQLVPVIQRCCGSAEPEWLLYSLLHLEPKWFLSSHLSWMRMSPDHGRNYRTMLQEIYKYILVNYKKCCAVLCKFDWIEVVRQFCVRIKVELCLCVREIRKKYVLVCSIPAEIRQRMSGKDARWLPEGFYVCSKTSFSNLSHSGSCHLRLDCRASANKK